MSEKTYLSGARLSLYDEKLKAKMATDDSVTLGSAKTYTDEELAAFGTEVDEALGALASAVNGKAPATHNHKISDVTNLQSELDGKSDAGHTHTIDSALSTTSTNPVQNKIVNEAIQSALTEANAYTDTKTSGLASTSSLTSTVNTHNTSTSSHSDIRDELSELNTKVNNFLNVTDTTKDQLSEIIQLIEDNADDIESITSGKVNVDDIVNNLTTNVSNKPLSAAQGVVLNNSFGTLQNNFNTLSDRIENGEFDGEDGVTPVRGVDYWTEADKAEIKSYVDEAILGGAW